MYVFVYARLAPLEGIVALMSGKSVLVAFLIATVAVCAAAESKKEFLEPILGGAFDFIPVLHGDVKVDSQPLNFGAGCFRSVSAHMEHFDDKGAELVITSSKASSLFCSDIYIVATAHQFSPQWVVMRGNHKVHLKWKTAGEVDFVKNQGVQIFELKGSIWSNIKALYDTWQIFDAKKNIAEYNLKFMKEKMGVEFPPRTEEDFTIDEKFIHSGDQFAIMRLDGLDPLIAWGTGGHTGHATVCLWMTDEKGERALYVAESTDANPFASKDVQWPPPYGIIRTPYRQWIEQAKRAHYLVNFLPLSEENRAKFDEAKAQDFFLKHQGLPYGYKNFLFGWLDVPKNNIPYPASPEIILTVGSVLNRYSPSTLDLMFNEGMNFRLGTKGLNFNEILEEVEKQGKNIWDVVGVPEKDEWEYSTGKSMVCNVFVQSVYKAAGIFGDLTDSIEAGEHTPRDTYSLKLYQNDWKEDPNCAAHGGKFEYCQFMGKYQMDLPEFNTIEPYAHMNERCTNDSRDHYKRPEGC